MKHIKESKKVAKKKKRKESITSKELYQSKGKKFERFKKNCKESLEAKVIGDIKCEWCEEQQ